MSFSYTSPIGELRYPVTATDSKKLVTQLNQYFKGTRTKFDISIDLVGTDFQKQVWNAIKQIPYGKTKTYGEIAKAIGKPKAARAIGQACNKNPVWVIIPCHRVVGSNGKLGGYAGGVNKKLVTPTRRCDH